MIEDEAPTEDTTEEAVPAPNPTPVAPLDEQARRWRLGMIVALAVAATLVISQAFLIFTLRDTNDELGALRANLSRVDAALDGVTGSVDGLEGAVGDVGDRITSLEEQRLALVSAGPNSAAREGPSAAPEPAPETSASVVTTALPRFQDGVADPALGMVLGEVTGIEYYSEQTVTFGPDDGIARAIFVWAHWCPYCQQEMPEIAAWVETQSEAHPNMEIVSVTTSIDESGPNPLIPYLDDNQWPFPVLFDDTGFLAQQLGVNAFPFWVFTAPDGTVLGRTAGLLPTEQLAAIFGQLEDIGANA